MVIEGCVECGGAVLLTTGMPFVVAVRRSLVGLCRTRQTLAGSTFFARPLFGWNLLEPRCLTDENSRCAFVPLDWKVLSTYYDGGAIFRFILATFPR